MDVKALPQFDASSLRRLLKPYRKPSSKDKVQRENAHYIDTLDTALTTERIIRVADRLGGTPANSLSIVDNGGGLLVSLNGEPYIEVYVGDQFIDETIVTCMAKGDGHAGTAILRFGGYLEDEAL